MIFRRSKHAYLNSHNKVKVCLPLCMYVTYMYVEPCVHRMDDLILSVSGVLTFQLFKSAASYPGLPMYFFTLHMTHLGNLVSFWPQ